MKLLPAVLLTPLFIATNIDVRRPIASPFLKSNPQLARLITLKFNKATGKRGLRAIIHLTKGYPYSKLIYSRPTKEINDNKLFKYYHLKALYYRQGG